MNRKIVAGQGYCAVLEDGRLMEYVPSELPDQCGNILTGRIDRLMPGMKCAFVDIGRKKSGFLPLGEESETFSGPKVRSGDNMILQVKKEETGEKGAYLTRDITLPGACVILMPMNRYIGVSSRIRDEAVRERLKEAGKTIAGGRFGLVMRNASAEQDTETVRLEAERLYDLWQKTVLKASAGDKPGKVLWSNDPAMQIREDYAAGGWEEVPETEGMAQEIRLQLREAAGRKHRLPGGGNIVIDRCEAMTVIDVNTASSAGGGSKEENVTGTNLEACEAIARQVRLRNLSGIILIDFIDMERETDRSLILRRLGECFSRDRIKTVIHGWTKLGLVEMTRKRTRPELLPEMDRDSTFNA